MNALLHSAQEKLAQADRHLQVLWDELKTFTESRPYAARSETNLKGTEQPIRCSYFIDTFTDPPSHWPLLIGDAIQNMRSALDHAAWTLVVKKRGKGFAEKNMRSIGFPIYVKEDGFNKNFVVAALTPDLRAVLEELQPYKRNAAQPNRDALWVLHELSNIDKHRTLNLVVIQGQQVKITTQPFLENGVPVFVEKGPLAAGVKVAVFTATRPLVAQNVNVNFELTAGISIQAPPRGAAVPLDIGLRELRARTAEATEWISASLARQ